MFFLCGLRQVHNAFHRAVGLPRPANEALLLALSVAMLGSMHAVRWNHLRHHRLSGTHRDPYLHPLVAHRWGRALLTLRGAMLPIWWTLRAFVAPFALHHPGARRFYARAFLQDTSPQGTDLAKSRAVKLCARADLRQAAAHLVAFGAVIAFELPFLVFYALPWVLAGMLNARRVIVEHDYSHPAERLSRAKMLDATCTHPSGALADLLLYPHNIGYHAAHHLAPSASFVYLPQIHARAVEGRGGGG